MRIDILSSASGVGEWQYSIAYWSADVCSTSIPVRGNNNAPGKAGARRVEADCQQLIARYPSHSVKGDFFAGYRIGALKGTLNPSAASAGDCRTGSFCGQVF